MKNPYHEKMELEIKYRYERCIRTIENLEDLVRNSQISIQKLAVDMEEIINNLEQALWECDGLLEEEKYAINDLRAYRRSGKNGS